MPTLGLRNWEAPSMGIYPPARPPKSPNFRKEREREREKACNLPTFEALRLGATFIRGLLCSAHARG